MIKDAMNLVIITPNGTFLDRGEVTYLEVKGTEGILGIMPNHSPFVTTLLPSAIFFRTKHHTYDLAMSEGLLYVTEEKVTILADAAYFKNQIDYRLTKELLNNALKRLKENKAEDEKVENEILLQEAMLEMENKPGRQRL